MKYLRKLEREKEVQQAQLKNKLNMERRLKQSQDVKDKRYQMFLNKRKIADDYKRVVVDYEN